MSTEESVVQADAPPASAPPVAEPPPEAKPEPEKPNREDELQRAVAAANQARRRAERDLAEQKLQWETANQRLAELAKKFTPAEPKPPDQNDDPVGALAHKSDRIDQRLEAWEKREQEREQRDAQTRQQADIERNWSMAAQSFAQKQPDFPQAYEHLFRNAMEEFEEAGYDQQTAGQLVQGYWKDIVARAQRDGVNPAERMYNLAKRRGYKAATPQDKIETIANGTKATSPLASASGKAPSKLTMEAIAEMKQEDFDKLSEADFKRIVNG